MDAAEFAKQIGWSVPQLQMFESPRHEGLQPVAQVDQYAAGLGYELDAKIFELLKGNVPPDRR